MAYEFHYRFGKDDVCEIVCTRCFQTIGSAAGPAAIQKLIASHACTPGIVKSDSVLIASPSGNVDHGIARFVHDFERMALPVPYLLALAVVIFYVIPTVLEVQFFEHVSLRFFCMIVGDLAGCIGIFFLLKKQKTAVLMYLALTVLEGALYSLRLMSAQVLPWMMDAIPTLLIVGRMVQLKSENSARGVS